MSTHVRDGAAKVVAVRFEGTPILEHISQRTGKQLSPMSTSVLRCSDTTEYLPFGTI